MANIQSCVCFGVRTVFTRGREAGGVNGKVRADAACQRNDGGPHVV